MPENKLPTITVPVFIADGNVGRYLITGLSYSIEYGKGHNYTGVFIGLKVSPENVWLYFDAVPIIGEIGLNAKSITNLEVA